MIDQALVGLIHILVFVYWLGGDLGAFYTSHYLTKRNVSPDRRLFAAKVVGDVDMAPRTALILALPTGLIFAETKGWLSLGWPVLVALSAASIVWIAIVWKLHTAHQASPPVLKTLDITLRYSLLVGLIVAGVCGLGEMIYSPLFISLKMLILAGCVALGLYIRAVLKPLGPALVGLNGSDSDRAETQLNKTLSQARPLVVCIWALLLTASFLGLWTPTSF